MSNPFSLRLKGDRLKDLHRLAELKQMSVNSLISLAIDALLDSNGVEHDYHFLLDNPRQALTSMFNRISYSAPITLSGSEIMFLKKGATERTKDDSFRPISARLIDDLINEINYDNLSQQDIFNLYSLCLGHFFPKYTDRIDYASSLEIPIVEDHEQYFKIEGIEFTFIINGNDMSKILSDGNKTIPPTAELIIKINTMHFSLDLDQIHSLNRCLSYFQKNEFKKNNLIKDGCISIKKNHNQHSDNIKLNIEIDKLSLLLTKESALTLNFKLISIVQRKLSPGSIISLTLGF
ncbi:hypothetical protein [Rosenbergiella collisarenosi]|uniref:hypothetical protein n=1 Tax=Rosenbergiella collisarenosi TaxID=1544695 RepID=UPI001F4D8104|nr:hypothetical protein [Rosenbergiella collisarenosi]